jgi:transcription termination factor Rho
MEKKPASAAADPSAAMATEPAALNPALADGTAPAPAPVEITIRVEGVLDIDLQRGGHGQLIDLVRGGKRRPTDPFVPKELIRRFKLLSG